jgi:glycosyltransferase involved in cell wall biosynthesis
MSSLPTIERFLRDHESGAYFERLVNQPVPHQRRTTPELFFHRRMHALEPQFTVVTPTFNAASMIAAQMNATAGAASLPFDWILIDDGSDDGTPEMAKAIFESTVPPLVARATIVRNLVPVFETACDNIGFSLAETEVIIEVQSDIQIREQGFDALILRILSTRPRPAAISGRCGHSFFGLRGRVVRALLGGRDDECVGLCGELIDTPEVVDPLKGAVYRCETVPRGPWVVLKSDLERAGYLDERFFFLGNDDHDYHRRLFDAEGRRPLYVPMSLHSPLHLGATRRKRSGINRDLFKTLRAAKRGSPEFQRFLAAQRRPVLPERVV